MKKMETTAAIKFIIIAVLINLTLGVFTLVWKFADSSSSIVYVDAIKLLSGYKGMEQAKKEYELKVSGWNANLDTLRIEVESQFKDYETRKGNLSSKQMEQIEGLLETKRQQYMDYQQVVAEKVKKEDQDLTTKVYAKVNDYLKRYGKEKGYKFILSANQYASIAYAEQGVDITNDVLEGLNAEFEK